RRAAAARDLALAHLRADRDGDAPELALLDLLHDLRQQAGDRRFLIAALVDVVGRVRVRHGEPDERQQALARKQDGAGALGERKLSRPVGHFAVSASTRAASSLTAATRSGISATRLTL